MNKKSLNFNNWNLLPVELKYDVLTETDQKTLSNFSMINKYSNKFYKIHKKTLVEKFYKENNFIITFKNKNEFRNNSLVKTFNLDKIMKHYIATDISVSGKSRIELVNGETRIFFVGHVEVKVNYQIIRDVIEHIQILIHCNFENHQIHGIFHMMESYLNNNKITNIQIIRYNFGQRIGSSIIIDQLCITIKHISIDSYIYKYDKLFCDKEYNNIITGLSSVNEFLSSYPEYNYTYDINIESLAKNLIDNYNCNVKLYHDGFYFSLSKYNQNYDLIMLYETEIINNFTEKNINMKKLYLYNCEVNTNTNQDAILLHKKEVDNIIYYVDDKNQLYEVYILSEKKIIKYNIQKKPKICQWSCLDEPLTY